MKRFKVLGLCLVAVFALSAVIASVASAEFPTYKICGKATKVGKLYTGKYNEKTCNKEASPAEQAEGKHNKYERVSWEAAKKKTFKAKNEGTPKNILVSPIHCSGKILLGKCEGTYEPGKEKEATEAGVTECTKEKGTGEVTGEKTAKFHTEYSHCKGNGVPCNTKEAKAEDINTDPLESTLANIEGASPHTEVGIRVKGLGPGGRLAQYECPALSINIEVFGEVFAKVEKNLNKAEGHTVDRVTHGKVNMQSNMYENGVFSEEQGKEFFETVVFREECVKGGHTVAECEAAFPFHETQPVTLISIVSGALSAKAPAVQNGVTLATGEKFLIEDN